MRRAVVPVVVPFVGVVALTIRLVPLLTGPGLLNWTRYDDGVYYTAAASLIDGRLPYRDFVLLHPPLIMLALTPFALLGRLTSDPAGLVSARVVWMLLGTGIAMLAARFAGRWGKLPALAAGLWVACSATSSYASRATFIEPVADLALLGAIVLLSCDRERPRHELAAGLLLGLALTGKIWYVVPVGTFLLVMLLHRRWRGVLRAGVVAAAVAALILLPFFLAAPHEMWHMVVYDQITRPVEVKATFMDRLGLAVGGRYLGFGSLGSGVVAIIATVVVGAGIAGAFRERATRPVAGVATATVALLLVSPSSFRHYGSLSAAPVAISVAVGWWLLGPRLLGVRRLRLGLAVAGLVAIAVGGVLGAVQPTGRHFPTRDIRRALPASGCIAADDPTTLIITDRLSSDLRAGCEVAVDVSGAAFGVRERRYQELPYLDWLIRYLRSGRAAVLSRPGADGLLRDRIAQIGTPFYRHGDIRVFRPALRPGP